VRGYLSQCRAALVEEGSAPGLLRRVVLVVAAWAALAVILILAGEAVAHSSAADHFDRHVTAVVVAHRAPALDAAMKAVTWIGSWVALVVTGLVLVVLTARGRLAVLALPLAVVAWAGESGGVTLAKHVVGRARPPEALWLVRAHGWSWPSGHSATAVLIYTIWAILITSIVRGGGWRAVTWAAAALAVAAVGFSRIELGVHWTTDVLASLVFVSSWLITLAVLTPRLRAPGGVQRLLVPRSSMRVDPLRSVAPHHGSGTLQGDLSSLRVVEPLNLLVGRGRAAPA
jgi:membrane-associated phospholipid phosphatase